jgi:hypothetical protein
MEHLSLEIFDLATKENPKPTTSQYAVLPENASITITDTSEIFASGDVWSHSFTLNVYDNVHIFGSAGDMHGARLHEQINKRRARLWVEGVAMFLGYLKLDDEAEVDEEGNVDVSFESGQKTFDEMIEGAKANQVPMMSDVQIGMALWRKRITMFGIKIAGRMEFDLEIPGHGICTVMTDTEPIDNGETLHFVVNGESAPVQQYPRMVFPEGDFYNTATKRQEHIDCVNTDIPFDEAHPYCNIALCYQRYGYKKKDDMGNTYDDYSSEPEAERGYEYMPAKRVNSAPNFYVIYWFQALMKHLGIYIEENQMMDVEDLRRLFFVNTACEHLEPQYLRITSPNERFGKYTFPTGSRLIPEIYNPQQTIAVDKSGGLKCEVKKAERLDYYGDWHDLDLSKVRMSASVYEVAQPSGADKSLYETLNNYLYKAIATSDCFPDADISEVISAIESGFGVRLLFSDNFQRVRIVLLRNLFRNSEVQHIDCDILAESKQESSIRGFRMTYGDNKDNTEFYYKGFVDKLPHMKTLWPDTSDDHDYSHWNLDAQYSSIIKKVSAFDKTCYVTQNTGNSFGIKIDKDAKRYEELHPSMFEFAAYMDAEDGDCTGEENTIDTINVGFTPAIMNDLNMEEERGDNGKTPVAKQKFALFCDETMRPRRPDLKDRVTPESYDDPDAVYDVDKMYQMYGPNGTDSNMSADGIVKPGEFAIASDTTIKENNLSFEAECIGPWCVAADTYKMRAKFDIIDGFVNEGYRLYLQDNYQPNDDGVCPVENHDWGLTLGIMRGSGSDAHVDYRADPDDGEGNDTWDIEQGSSATAHPDTCDCYGNEWDYNGSESGIGSLDGRVSLKLRAEKPNPYFDPTLPETHYDPAHPELNTNPRYLHITNPNLQQRGLADQFYKEYSYWVRNARICKRTVTMELAQLLSIDKTKKVSVGDVTGFIRKMQYSVSNETGLSEVTMEIMYI